MSTSKRARVQDDVVRAMEELLTENGTYADLNVERLAGRAGISRTSFYFYFRDKREVLERLTATIADELYAAADVWWSASGVRQDVLRTAIGNIATLFTQHGPLLRAIVEVGTYEREVAEHWRSLVGRFIDATEQRIIVEQTAGNAPDYPAGPTAFALVWGVERTFYQQLVQESAYTNDELVEALSSAWLRTIYGRPDPQVTTA